MLLYWKLKDRYPMLEGFSRRRDGEKKDEDFENCIVWEQIDTGMIG